VGCIWLNIGPGSPAGKTPLHWIVGVGLFVAAIYLAVTAAYSVVIFSRDSITVRGVLQTRSIHTSSVKGYKYDWSRRTPRIRLISNSPDESDLLIAKNYAFDEEWRDWLSRFPDPDAGQEARFTLK
jgi:hypothetical protein